MSTQLLFYAKVEPVTKAKHTDLYVKTGTDYAFAKDINSVPLMAVEFSSAAVEYPIMFTGEGENIIPVAILGTHQNENVFYNDEQGWQAKYIPAFVRRYPFVFSSSNNGDTLVLCIDESYEGCNRDGKGERLFDGDGEQTQYLQSTLKFLEEYQAHFRRTQAFCAKLNELDLLEPVTAQFQNPQGVQRKLTGILAINRDKLKALPAETLAELVSTDALELAYLHLQSMRNFNTMLERAAPEQESAMNEG